MHELSLALNIIDIVASRAAAEGGHTITEIEVDVGQLAGVQIDSLEFCFQAARKATPAENAALKIIPIPGKGRCSECRHEFAVAAFFASCPQCGGFAVEILEGKDLKIRSISIEE